MPYPDLLASGITELGRYDPTGPYLGGGNTDQAYAADGIAIAQWQVCTLNAAQKLIPYAGGGDFASGTLTFTANPTAADTVTINAVPVTFVASGATGNQVNIVTGDFVATAQALKTLINANPSVFAVGASGAAGVLTLMAIAGGSAGNSITIAKSGTQPAVSGATLAGGGTTEGVPSGNALFVAAQPVPAATPGQSCPIFVSGRFQHNGLLWPAGMETLDQRRSAFAGTAIFVVAVL